MRYLSDDVLECQQCGEVLKELSPAEAQEVSYDPYNFVVYCDECKGIIKQEVEFRDLPQEY